MQLDKGSMSIFVALNLLVYIPTSGFAQTDVMYLTDLYHCDCAWHRDEQIRRFLASEVGFS